MQNEEFFSRRGAFSPQSTMLSDSKRQLCERLVELQPEAATDFEDIENILRHVLLCIELASCCRLGMVQIGYLTILRPNTSHDKGAVHDTDSFLATCPPANNFG
jgi:hypothetical protein